MTAEDPDGDSASLTLVDGPNGAVLDEETGLLSWTASTNQEGPHTFTVEAMDEHGAKATQTWTVVVQVVDPNAGDASTP